jgi:hypothetical protein
VWLGALYVAAALVLMRTVSGWRRGVGRASRATSHLRRGRPDGRLAMDQAVGLFLVDYIVGDDWTVAALIALGLLAAWRLVEAGSAAWWLLPLVVLAANVQSLRRAVRNGG